MKRSPELTRLSHDHHQALFVAQRLKRAKDASPAGVFLDFMASHGERHFYQEESILLPAWFAASPDADAAMAERVAAEHLALRTHAEQLRNATPPVEELQRLGEALERHVRFEERELFPRIESDLDSASLSALGARLSPS